VRSSRSSGGALTSPERGKNWYSVGKGNSPASMNIRLSRPCAVRMSCMAISEPSASPSRFSWVTTISLSAERSSSRTSSLVAAPAPFSPIRFGPPGADRDLINQLRDPHAAIDRLVVFEGQRRRVLERQLGGHAPLEEAVG